MKMRISILFVMLTLMAGVGLSQQPFAGCWHLDYIKTWTPDQDPDAKYNRSSIPLQPRFTDETVRANTSQFSDAQIAAAFIMSPMCSRTPSQGDNNFIGFSPTYWQYLDVMIWSGGSAGEGIIIPPSAPVVDAAHQSGVKVLGQVFLTVTEFGGQPSWVKELVSKQNGEYIYAKKLYEIAKYYGFDGWAINKKTPSDDTPDQWEGFVTAFNQMAQQDNNSDMLIQFYDAGKDVSSRLELVKQQGVSYFLECGNATADVIATQMGLIQGIGLSKQQAMHKLYFGLECAQGGIGGNANFFKTLFTKTAHNASTTLFNPEEGIWKMEVEQLLGTPNVCGEKAYAAIKKSIVNEGRFFTNVRQDPSNVSGWTGASWPGLANAITEKSTIQNKPFVTNFSSGQGKKRYINGVESAVQDWYHRGMQDIMPTWRWWIEGTTKTLKVDVDWDDAYNQGSSLLITGKLTAGVDNRVKLYKTKLKVAAGDKFQLVYKLSEGDIEAHFGISEEANKYTSISLTPVTNQNGWSVAEIDLSQLAGKTISVIALNFKTASNIETLTARLGQLAVYPASYNPAPVQVRNLIVQNKLKQDGGDIRLSWDAPLSSDVHHYNIYFTQGGVKKLVGQTRSEAFYIPKFARTSMSETSVSASVSVVTKDMKEGSLSSIEASYPDLTLPVVSIKARKTLIKPNEPVVVIARADNLPSAYRWSVPEGARIASQSGDSATIVFDTMGTYDIAVSVDNSKGTTQFTAPKLIQVSDSKSIDLVSVKKSIHSASNFLDPERPEWLLDGVTVPGSVRDKWCIGGRKEHWVIIDLLEVYELFRFKIYDCGNKESAADNFTMYKILVSSDLENWSLMVDEKSRPESVKDDYIAPTKGRYVKLVPYNDELPITIRLWEFEVYGAKGTLSLATPDAIEMKVGETKTNTLQFSLGGANKATDFAVRITPQDPTLALVKNIQVGANNDLCTYELEALGAGKTNVTIELLNDGWSKQVSYELRIADASLTNIALNRSIVAITGEDKDEDPTAGDQTAINDGNYGSYWSSSWSSSDAHKVSIDLGTQAKIYSFRVLFKEVTNTYIKPGEFTILVGETQGSLQAVSTLESASIQFDNEINLSTPVDGRYVELQLKSANDFAFALAEFEVFGKIESALHQELLEGYSLTPNPISIGQELHVTGEGLNRVELLSLQGVVLQTVAADLNTAHLYVRSCIPGVYLVKSYHEGGYMISKLIVR